MYDDIGGPRGYPRTSGITMRGKSQYAARTHDHYYACVSERVRNGVLEGPCEFWTYDSVKAARHDTRKKHIVVRRALDVLDEPPGIVHGDAH